MRRTLITIILTVLLAITQLHAALQRGCIPASSTEATFIAFQSDKEIIIDTEGYFSIVYWQFDTEMFCDLSDKRLHIWVCCVPNKEIYYDTHQRADEYTYWGTAEKVDENRIAPVLTVEYDWDKQGALLEWEHDEKHPDGKIKYEVYKRDGTCFKWIGHVPQSTGKNQYLDKKAKPSDCYVVIPTVKEKVVYGPRSNVACINDEPLPVKDLKYNVRIATKWGLIKR